MRFPLEEESPTAALAPTAPEQVKLAFGRLRPHNAGDLVSRRPRSRFRVLRTGRSSRLHGLLDNKSFAASFDEASQQSLSSSLSEGLPRGSRAYGPPVLPRTGRGQPHSSLEISGGGEDSEGDSFLHLDDVATLFVRLPSALASPEIPALLVAFNAGGLTSVFTRRRPEHTRSDPRLIGPWTRSLELVLSQIASRVPIL